MSQKTPCYDGGKKRKKEKPLECIDLPVNCTGRKNNPSVRSTAVSPIIADTCHGGADRSHLTAGTALSQGLKCSPLPSRAGFQGSSHQHRHLLSPTPVTPLGWEGGGLPGRGELHQGPQKGRGILQSNNHKCWYLGWLEQQFRSTLFSSQSLPTAKTASNTMVFNTEPTAAIVLTHRIHRRGSL